MSEKFIRRFEVPEQALGIIDHIVTPTEQLLIEALEQESFSASEAKEALDRATCNAYSAEQVDALLRSAYRRGVLRIEDEGYARYRTATFYGRLDVFAVTEPDAYRALPDSERKALDEWYFGAYLKQLDPQTEAPTQDRVLPLAETLTFLDAVEVPIWLNNCDCRILAGNCDSPVDTCISLRNGINTMSHRGWSKRLTKEQAKDVVRRADAAGLVHTVNPNSVCNCCVDCCYLFRAQRTRQGDAAVWPAASMSAHYEADSCIGCGICVDRCPFGAFTQGDAGITFGASRCRGCALCVQTCPTGAIQMKRRDGT